MRHESKHCIQCGTPYWYQSSGHGSPDNNHREYCPDCYDLVLASLKDIKKKFAWKYVDASNEVTYDELIQAEKDEISKQDKTKIYGRRVYAGLFNMSTGDTSGGRDIKVNGIEYHLDEWNLSPEYTISRRVYWDLVKNEPVDKSESRDLKLKTLINPNKSYPPIKEVKICPVQPLTEPLGLSYALRFACDHQDRLDVLNYELGVAGLIKDGRIVDNDKANS